MVNIDTGSYVTLNPTAHAIWEALATPQTAQQVEAALTAQFDVAEDVCATAVARTLSEMETQQLARVI